MTLAVTFLISLLLLFLAGLLTPLCRRLGIAPLSGGLLCVCLLLLSGIAVPLGTECVLFPACLVLGAATVPRSLLSDAERGRVLLLPPLLAALLYLPGRQLLFVQEPGLLLGIAAALCALAALRTSRGIAAACFLIPQMFSLLLSLEELLQVGCTQWRPGSPVQLDAQLCALCIALPLHLLLRRRRTRLAG